MAGYIPPPHHDYDSVKSDIAYRTKNRTGSSPSGVGAIVRITFGALTWPARTAVKLLRIR